MPLIVEFRTSSLGRDSTPAFGIFWLREIPDEEEKTVVIEVWAGGKENLKRATTCARYQGIADGEQPLGEIEVTLKFWRGLSGFHKKWAQKDKSGEMRNVMEILDTVNDEIQDDDESGQYEDSSSSSDKDEDEKPHGAITKTPRNQKLTTHSNQSNSSLSSTDTTKSKNPFKKLKKAATDLMESHNDPNDGKRGVVGQIRDYKDHRKQLHRRHRGLMQWKVARTGEWALDKGRRAVGTVGSVFEHGEKEGGIEREV